MALVGSSSLRIFDDIPVNAEIIGSQLVDYYPVTSISDNSPIEFFVPKTRDYIDLQSVYLTIEAKIVKDDGTEIVYDADNKANCEQVGPVNNWASSLFEQVHVKLNGTDVNQSSKYYPYISYLHNLLYYGDEAKTSKLTAALYYKDTKDKMDSSKPWIEDGNQGLRSRAYYTRSSRTVQMMARIHADIFECPKLLCPMVDIRIVMHRSSPEFCLMADKPDYKVVIQNAVLHVRQVTPIHSIARSHLEHFTLAKYPVRRTEVATYTVSQGDQSFLRQNVFSGRVPDLLTMIIVPTKSFNGDFKRNPFYFRHANLSMLNVSVGGKSVTGTSMKLDLSKEKYDKAFINLYENTKKGFMTDGGNDISFTEFRMGYTVFLFDLTVDQTPYDLIKSVPMGSNVQVEGQFSEAATEALEIIMIGRYTSYVQIDKNRSVELIK